MKKVLVTIILSVIVLSSSRLAAGQAAPNSLDARLFQAVESGDSAAVQELLQEGANIEAKDVFGSPLLFCAVMFGRADVVKLLLEKGGNIEAKNNEGDTALSEAAYYAKTDMVKLLLEKGANIEAKDDRGHTALLRAVSNGKVDAVKLLLENGADTEAKDKYGDTALLRAQGNTEVVKLLLEKGANVEAKDGNQHSTALMNAVHYGHTEVVKLLLDKGANIEARNNFGSTALLTAASFGHTELVELLLDKGANIEDKDNYGRGPLTDAASGGKVDVVKLLLDRGANIEARGRYGNTALLGAAEEGKTEVVKLLLESGANIEAKNENDWTALILAANKGKAEVVNLLLEKGANIAAKDSYGETALSRATESRNNLEDLVKQHSGDPTWSKDLSDQTEVVRLLKQVLSKDAGAGFAEHVSYFQRQPDDEAREKIVKLAAGLATPPAIPEEARQLFVQASALMKQRSAPAELAKPIELLRRALVIAPWWANAYYNLSRALELDEQYDEAVKQLNYYLELNPPEADAREARDHISVIQAEKEAAAQKKQENEGVLAVKYVSGGVTRLRYNDAPAWWHDLGRVDTLYTYWVPEEAPFYVNVFRMPSGHLLTITLLALSSNGAHTADQIAVYAWDATKGGCSQGYTFAFGEHSYTNACGVHYDVEVSNQPNAIVTVTYTPTGASVTLPVPLLFRCRARKAWESTVYQGSVKGVEVLHFDESLVKAAEDPGVNAMGLTPTSVTPYKK
jgi:ankyrin repeat protein